MLAVALACTLPTSTAEAITVSTPMTELSDYQASASGVTYTFSGYTVENGESATGAVITFPAGTDLTSQSLALLSPKGTIERVDPQTVTVRFTPALSKKANNATVVISIGGIINPNTAGTYTVGNTTPPGMITFKIANPNGNSSRPDQEHPSASYEITPVTPSSYLSMTITTPSDGQTVDFGSVDPGVTTGPRSASLKIASSSQYMITRVVRGAIGELGLAVAGVPVGTALGATPAAAPATFTDTFTLKPPWSTDPEVALSASVAYTVVQQL